MRSLFSIWLVASSLACALAACGGAQSAGGGGTGLLEVGSTAPDFLAPDQTGEPRRFEALRGGHAAVLFFYPRDGTPGCTAEACAFRDAWDRLEAAGAVVIGVSTDDWEMHQRFAEEHDLQFPLLSDPEGRVLARYGVPRMMNMASRVTFIVGRDGRIARVFIDVDPGVHVEEVLAALAELPAPEPAARPEGDPGDEPAPAPSE